MILLAVIMAEKKDLGKKDDEPAQS